MIRETKQHKTFLTMTSCWKIVTSLSFFRFITNLEQSGILPLPPQCEPLKNPSRLGLKLIEIGNCNFSKNWLQQKSFWYKGYSVRRMTLHCNSYDVLKSGSNIQASLDCDVFTALLTRLIGILTFDIWQTRQNAILTHTNG